MLTLKGIMYLNGLLKRENFSSLFPPYFVIARDARILPEKIAFTYLIYPGIFKNYST